MLSVDEDMLVPVKLNNETVAVTAVIRTEPPAEVGNLGIRNNFCIKAFAKKAAKGLLIEIKSLRLAFGLGITRHALVSA